MGKLPSVLAELKQIVITPIKPHVCSPPVSQSETADTVNASVGVIGDPPDPDDLPSQIVKVMGKGTILYQTQTVFLFFFSNSFNNLSVYDSLYVFHFNFIYTKTRILFKISFKIYFFIKWYFS